jgi:type I restriction enzyme M protein
LVEQSGRRFESFSEASNFLWSIADLLRGDYKQHDYGKVILPLTVLRRLDCVLLPTKAQVLAKHAALEGGSLKNADALLNRITGVPFHNVSKLTFTQLKDDPTHLRQNLVGYIEGFNQDAREIFIQRFKFGEQVDKLDESNLLYQVVSRFGEVDLHPDVVDTHMMGSIFEDLIRRFAEQANETAGEHFTPREVIRLMVDLVFTEDNAVLSQPGVVKTLYDPACGTGGMLGVAEEYLYELNPRAKLEVFGQELNDESFAICKADMMIKGQNPQNIQRGNSFSEDGHAGRQFDYMLSNPPFGVEWKKVEKEIRDEHEKLGFAGRFGAGLPRISDGSLLFLQHMVSKMTRRPGRGRRQPPGRGVQRLAAVHRRRGQRRERDPPLAVGERLARGHRGPARPALLQHGHQHVRLAGVQPQARPPARQGAAHQRHRPLREDAQVPGRQAQAAGRGRHQVDSPDLRGLPAEGEASKVFRNEDFGFHKITVERPLRLNFHVSPERLERLEAETAFANLTKTKKKGEAGKLEIAEGRLLQESVRHVLNGMMTAGGKAAATPSRDRKAFTKALSAAFKKADVSVPPGVLKAVLSALSERDEDAPPCVDSKGQPEADADLRDTESVPLTERIADYFEREVKPQVPDAWIDESKTKVGYEIPFTRHFYKYEPLRPLSVIEAEIRALEAEIQGMLGEVLG